MSFEADPYTELKASQREGWAPFASLAVFTTSAAASLVEFAQVGEEAALLDVACGTGVVAITAARNGARVQGLDLSPALLEHARKHAGILDLSIEFKEGDIERLPYPDATFDVVLSQFGHIFAPRPDIAIAEMLRVLKLGGRIAFSTWPPELLVGRMMRLAEKYVPATPGVASPTIWGDPNAVRQRLGDAVTDVEFDSGEILIPTLSPRHYCVNTTRSSHLFTEVNHLLQSDPPRLARFRAEFEALVGQYFSANRVRQSFLMTRAFKR